MPDARHWSLTGCRVLAALLLAALPEGPARAQESGLTFLRLGIDAAGSALGEAHVAHSRDAFSTYWNPAGLAAATVNMAALSHRSWVGGEAAYALATRFRAGTRAGVGLSVTAQGSGDLQARDDRGELVGTFRAHFVSVGASYGRRIGPVRAGVTAKYLSERIYNSAATGYAFDLGLQADLLGAAVQVGAAVQNLGAMSALDAVKTPLPRLLRAGVALYPLDFSGEGPTAQRLLLTGEVVHLFPGRHTQLHMGAALRLLDLVTLRSGFMGNDALRRFTFGGGLDYRAFRFDYAFIPFEGGFEGPGHLLTLSYAW